MQIEKLHIKNYKCFYEDFTLELNDSINIIVGDNEAGKSTILEAVHLALTGLINGRYLRNEITQYLFNINVLNDFFHNVNNNREYEMPYSLIEVFFKGKSNPMLRGNGNSDKAEAEGVYLKIEFDENYKSEFEELVKDDSKLLTLPIEYYKITWRSFARENITSRSIPIKPVLIDSSSYRLYNGSDIYVSRIIKDNLEDSEKAGISQAFRKLREEFMEDDAIKKINDKLKEGTKVSSKDIKISADLSTRNAWETTLMTYLDEVPFGQIGKGEQCVVKTNLALSHKKNKEANLILLEEPENHLSHVNLNKLISGVLNENTDKQIIISTHSNYVANKLGLENLILINNKKTTKLSELSDGTYSFFKKLPGFDTLRMILSQRTILVEGPSDELIVQKAYMQTHDGKLPIEDGIDIISVRLAFKRFLEIAKKLALPVAVVTDNDGNYQNNIQRKYEEYDEIDNIKIFYDTKNELNTLEPQFIHVNHNKPFLCRLLGLSKEQYREFDDIEKYMTNNKTEWALKVFEYKKVPYFPEYINRAITWCDEE